jgi:hypothetical protein
MSPTFAQESFEELLSSMDLHDIDRAFKFIKQEERRYSPLQLNTF